MADDKTAYDQGWHDFAKEAIGRMTKLMEIWSKHGYDDSVRYTQAIHDCCGVIREMEEKNG